jgi:hypothetical protein
VPLTSSGPPLICLEAWRPERFQILSGDGDWIGFPAFRADDEAREAGTTMRAFRPEGPTGPMTKA